MIFVGGSVTVSGTLSDAPLLTTQALRYAIACAVLTAWIHARGRTLVRPRGAEWLWLLAVALTGLMLFNVALVRGADHAQPAVFAVAMAGAPLVLAIAGPLAHGRPPTAGVVVAAGIVSGGAALVEGGGKSDGIGLAWAAAVLSCEAAFTLLAVPVLARLGAWSVSTWTTGIAAVLLIASGMASEGPTAVRTLSGTDVVAVAYLALAVTAAAFVLWYSAVSRLGSGRAGLLIGIAPLASAVTAVLLGRPTPDATGWIGIGVVCAGLCAGFSSGAGRSGRGGGDRE